MSDKKTIFVISDHPLSPSGVGLQTKYMIESMLKTEKYKFFCFGGAIGHENYNLVKTEEYGDDFVIQPVDGYGTPEMIRSVIFHQKPDMMWIMTDPRFWGWLWEMDNEIRNNIPLIYYHVWDNYPYPHFNKTCYESNDVVVTISKVTDDIVRKVAPDVDCFHVPHTVNTEVFQPLADNVIKSFKHKSFPNEKNSDKITFFWNSRNARRKQSGSLIFWFKSFLDVVGHQNARLIMHTDPKDVNGQDLDAILSHLKLTDGQVLLSKDRYPAEVMSSLYNMADCTIGISDAEGFGLSTFESLACGTPIIVNMTGGLQEQVTDGEDWFGIGIEPCSKAIIGSQEIPYIYEDRISEKDFVDSLLKMYNMSAEERREMGEKGRQHILKNYSLEQFAEKWEDVFTHVEKKHGSWKTRKNYKAWKLLEVS